MVSAEDVSVEDVQDSAKTAGLFTPISPASATAPSVLPQVFDWNSFTNRFIVKTIKFLIFELVNF